ncbi:MAG: hypothetical protein V3T05_01720, partial [Myxococcota bacterium]
MGPEQVEVIPNADATQVEVRVKLDLRQEPFATLQRRSEAVHADLTERVAKMSLREQQLNAGLDDLSQRLGRAQA